MESDSLYVAEQEQITSTSAESAPFDAFVPFFSQVGEFLGPFFSDVYFWIKVLSLFISILLVFGIVYSVIRINTLRSKQKAGLKEKEEPIVGTTSGKTFTGEKSARWKRVLDLASSESEGDWRLAIIEADVILDELTVRMQYRGDSLGERLKSVERSDFNTIDDAWDAHKVRNQIAHAGGDFRLSKREADKAIERYRRVFEEFHYI